MLDERQRFNVAACGRQMGKTTLGIRLAALGVQDGWPCAWMAPTYKYLEDVWRQLRHVLEPVTIDKSEQQHRIATRSGGSVECWSLDDPDAARGRKYRRIVVDEAALVRDLETVWQASLRPTLSVLQGDAWFLSTPKGLDAFHALYQLGQDPLQPEWRSWQMPSSASPFISPDEIAAARAQLPERTFAQEYLADFVQLEGAGVFRGVRAVSRLQQRGPERGHQYVCGVDWGRTNDFTAISVIDATLGEQVALDRFSDIDFEYQAERLHRWAELYHPVQIVAEANSLGGPLVERLQTGYARLVGKARAALPIYAWTATNASKAAVIQALALAIEQGQVTLLDDQVQQAELLAFESSITLTGMVRYAAPTGQHDDTVIALALANLGATLAGAPQARSHYGFAAGARR
jgi:phage FluMu gp28-like protein